MPYVEFDVRPGTAERIARFHREVIKTPADVIGNGKKARVQAGDKQYLYFRETDEREKPYDKHSHNARRDNVKWLVAERGLRATA